MHDNKFSSKLIAQDKVNMFQEDECRNRKLIAIDCKGLLKDCQRFKFSPDGKFIAAANQNGTKISIIELIVDSRKALHNVVLICILHKSLFSSHIKSMSFSHDNYLVTVTSDTAKVHIFNISYMINAKHSLKIVRKNEIKACMMIPMA